MLFCKKARSCRTPIYAVLVSAALGLTCTVAQGAMIVTENFESDLGGWGQNSIGTTVQRIANGGNPGGYLESTVGITLPTLLGAANFTSDYSGDYVAAGINNVMVDLNFFSGTFTSSRLRFRSSAGTNGWSISLTNQFLNQWQSFNVVFDPTWSNANAMANGWGQLAPEVDFATLWTNVHVAEVRLMGVSGTNLVAGIDNFSLKPVPEPSTMLLLGSGLAGLGWFRRRKIAA